MPNYSASLHASIAAAYRGLALLMLGPTYLRERGREELAVRLLEEAGNRLAESPCAEAASSILRLARSLAECLRDNGCWHRFNRDYTETLVTQPGGAPCPPYESVYRINSGKHRLMGAPAVSSDLRRYYSKLGVEAVEEAGVTVDHVSVELEFMAALHQVEAKLLEGEGGATLIEEVRSIRRDFLVSHIYTWIPAFAECLLENAGSEVLREAAHSMAGLADCEGLLYA
jgi:TorA maturation chaperone TorD